MKPREIALAIGVAVILTAGVFFYMGWYKWEHRPPQTVNHIQYINGTNATVTQNTDNIQKQKLNGISIGYDIVDKGAIISYTRFF